MPSATLRDALKTTQDVTPILSAGGTIAGGIERQNEANAQAAQLERNAGQAKAVGQRNALNTDLMTRLTQSPLPPVAACPIPRWRISSPIPAGAAITPG